MTSINRRLLSKQTLSPLGILAINKHVHLINPLSDASGGSEWRTINLYGEILKHRKASLWSRVTPDYQLSNKYDINKILPQKLLFPKMGTFIFVGTYFHIGKWYKFTFPTRVILICNTDHKENLLGRIKYLSKNGYVNVEIIYSSRKLKDMMGIHGTVHQSFIDINIFQPNRVKKERNNDFVVGRLSRDVLYKHYIQDINLYSRLSKEGVKVRIMGGICLNDKIPKSSSIELIPACSIEPYLFLNGIDCMYYRTSDECFESFGRVVAEAMACGLPVVCHNRGGYTDFIVNGENGYLFDTDEEAYNLIMKLKSDVSLRERIGVAARKTMQELYSNDEKKNVTNFYI